ncbi:MAG: hypothetical protein GXO63_02240 [Candidatus Micrarchaeota archaeon]|nr:hypothetical protein [Candidatus Micrarchaeota archaeon]
MLLSATCNPGLEEIAIQEIKERVGREAEMFHRGLLVFKGKEKDIFKLNYFSKTLHRIIIVIEKARIKTLNDIYSAVKKIDFSSFIKPEQTFAVRTKRHGTHPFTSIDISSVIGQGIIDSFQETTGKKLKVNLSEPDITFLSEVRGDSFLLGIDTTGESLHKRWYRKHTYITSLRSTIANSMVRISRLRNKETFLDPMCGVGMIPIEAYHFLSEKPNKFRNFAFEKLFWLNTSFFEKLKTSHREKHVESRIYGFDSNRKVVELSVENSRVAEAKVNFFVSDATVYPLDFDRICVDMPYGIRMKTHLRKLYDGFFRNLLRSDFKKAVILTASKCMKFVPKMDFEKIYTAEYGDIGIKILVLG